MAAFDYRRAVAHANELAHLSATLEKIRRRAGVQPGEAFRVTTAMLEVEAGMSPTTLARARYLCEREGFATFDSRGSGGTWVTIVPLVSP